MNTQCSPNLHSELRSRFGFSRFRKGQLQVIEKVTKGESVIAIFPTGAGKSLCYQLPATMLPGITIVVSPLLSLMKDQLKYLYKHNISAASLDSTLNREQYHEVLAKAQRGELKVLMISVERFRNERFRSHLSNMNVSLLVVDEAHCISEWGHNFRPEYLRIPVYKKEFSIKQVLLLTATATVEVGDDIRAKFAIAPQNVIRTGFYRKNLHINVCPVKEEERITTLVRRLKTGEEQFPAIIYVTLQKSAEMVAEELKKAGIEAHAYHAGMENGHREQIQNRFMDSNIECVVATIAFGMGIDKSDIRSVIHFDLPKSIEGYSQEIGRAGRDDLDASCTLLANRCSIVTLENFIYGDTPEKSGLRVLLDEIKAAGSLWEVKLVSLSNKTNIRQLPLKTALVYLEMEGIITSLYTYFSEYQFKTVLSDDEIVSGFSGERAQFLRRLLEYSVPKKTWNAIDLFLFVETYGYERKRAVAALEYLDSKGLIELSVKQAVDVYRVSTNDFDSDSVADNLYGIFDQNQSHQIKRISEMVGFFERNTCLSSGLSRYFGENTASQSCGHCSVCIVGPLRMEVASEQRPLSSYSIEKLTEEFTDTAGQKATPVMTAKFLCGISSPLFTKIKAKKLGSFAMLENYPFRDVLSAVEALSGKSAVTV